MIYKFIILILLIIFFIKHFYKKEERFNNNNLFEIYVLYVPKRLEYIKNVMKKLDIKPQYIKGPDKNILNIDKLVDNGTISSKWIENTKAKKKNIKQFNKGRVACHLGHLKAYQKLLDSKSKYAIIFEDDIKLPNFQIKDKIKNIIDNLPSDADIVYLSYCFEYCKKTKYINEIFSKAYRPLCLHFHLVSREGANKIITNTLPMRSSSDRMIGGLISRKILNGYLVNPEYLKIDQKRNVGNIFDSMLDNNLAHQLCMEYYLKY